jgi:hypothetical protein
LSLDWRGIVSDWLAAFSAGEMVVMVVTGKAAQAGLHFIIADG